MNLRTVKKRKVDNKMKEEKLKELMEDIYKENTCMIIYKNKNQMEDIVTHIRNNVKENDVFAEISLNDWNKLQDENGVVKYKEQFYNIMQKLMSKLSEVTGKEASSVYKRDVTKTLIPLLQDIQVDYKNCFIVIKDFERINDIFPDGPDEKKKQFFPLDQLMKLTIKYNDESEDILARTYIVLLSSITIEQIDIFEEYKDEKVHSGWPYKDINAGEDE